ncbi:SPOR domain-containing protein OS=Streptomyces rimosus subsp. rimosus (strain ATCC / DSM 40260/ JCM 4667 / NRRL 2234) OX=1265868 GN=SRIM_011395 PE=4 SV=1 [Streptomyces rimosus subsp. rimosus]
MALFKRRTAGKPGEWFYCLKHGTVEEGPQRRAADRFGPYATREEAAHAMQTAQERNLEWETDPRWHEKNEEKGPGESA